MFNIVLPEIRKEFHLSLAQVSWVSTAYMLTYAIGSVTYAKLADLYRLKNLLTVGLIILACGSFIGLTAQTFWIVLVGRTVQAIGAAVIPAAATIIPVRYFSPENRGYALGLLATGLSLGIALGPIVAAFILSELNWRWLFCAPLLVILSLPFYRKYLVDQSRKGTESFDWIGGILLAGTVAFLLLGITNSEWGKSIVSIIFLILFIVRLRLAAHPFIKLNLFRNKLYSNGLFIAFLVSASCYSIPFLSPILLSHVNGLDSEQIGFTMFPAAVVAAVLGRYGGDMADSKGSPFLFRVASALVVVCFVLLSAFAGASSLFISVFLIFGQVGQTFMTISMSNSISRMLPKEQIGVGMGMLALLNFIAYAISANILSKWIDMGYGFLWNPVHSFPKATVYSNIYFVLATLHVGIFLFYNFTIIKNLKIASTSSAR